MVLAGAQSKAISTKIERTGYLNFRPAGVATSSLGANSDARSVARRANSKEEVSNGEPSAEMGCQPRHGHA